MPDRAALDAELTQVRRRGWAVERGQNLPGTVCVGVRVEYRIPATDALSCSLPADLATDAEVERVAGVLVRAAHRLAHDLRAAGVR